MSQDAINANTDTITTFLGALDLEEDDTYPSNQTAQQHLVVDNVPLKEIVSQLLIDYRVQGSRDTADLIGLLLQLQRAVEADPSETGRVYHMRPNYKSHRGVDEEGRIGSIRRVHQGPTRAGEGYSYPGDFAFRDATRVCTQIHFFDLTEVNGGPSVRQNVPILTVWVPKRLEADWVTQDQQDDDAD